MKKIIIIFIAVIASLLLLLVGAHLFILLTPRLQVFNTIENMESPEWVENFKSDYYEINASYIENAEEKNNTANANVIFDVKKLKLGADIEFMHDDEKTSGIIFATDNKISASADFFEQPIIIYESLPNSDSSQISAVYGLLEKFYNNLKDGKGDYLFSVQRQDISVLNENLGRKTVITVEFTHHDIKAICPKEYEKIGDFELSIKIDIVIGFVGADAYRAEGKIVLTEPSETVLSFGYEYNENTEQNAFDIEIINTDGTIKNRFAYNQNNIDNLNHISFVTELNRKREIGTKSTFAEIKFDETEKNIGNGNIKLTRYNNKKENEKPIIIELPFEYSDNDDSYKLHFEKIDIDYGGILISAKYNLDFVLNIKDEGINIGLDVDIKVKSVVADFNFNLDITKADGFDKTIPENAVSLNETIKNDFQNAFIGQRPKTAELFGLIPSEESEND